MLKPTWRESSKSSADKGSTITPVGPKQFVQKTTFFLSFNARTLHQDTHHPPMLVRFHSQPPVVNLS